MIRRMDPRHTSSVVGCGLCVVRVPHNARDTAHNPQPQDLSYRARRTRLALSVVEVLMAFALLSFLVLPVVQVVVGRTADITRTALHTQALFLGQGKMEEVLLTGFEHAGEQPDQQIGRFRLSVTAAKHEGLPDLKRVTVTVSWTDRIRDRPVEVELTTLLFQP